MTEWLVVNEGYVLAGLFAVAAVCWLGYAVKERDSLGAWIGMGHAAGAAALVWIQRLY